jgi:hypothetical protein
MPPGQVRVTCHKINVPFSKWTNKNYRVKRGRRCTQLMIVDLAHMKMLDRKDAIFKQQQPKIYGS